MSNPFHTHGFRHLRNTLPAIARVTVRASRLAVVVLLTAMPLGHAATPPLPTPSVLPDAAPPVAASRVVAVTVHPGWARVRRRADVTLTPGSQRIRLAGLPLWIVPESVVATAQTADTAHSAVVVEVKMVNPAELPPDPELAAAQAVQTDLQNRLATLNARETICTLERQYLAKLAVAPPFPEALVPARATDGAATAAVPNGTVIAMSRPTVEELRNLRSYFASGMAENSDTLLAIKRQQVEVQAALSAQQLVTNRLTSRSSASRRALDLIIQSPAATPATITVEYLLPGAVWTPSYLATYDPADPEHLSVEIRASILQITGETWDGAAVTVAAAAPPSVEQPPMVAAYKSFTTAIISNQDLLRSQREIETLASRPPGSLTSVLTTLQLADAAGRDSLAVGVMPPTAPSFPSDGGTVLVSLGTLQLDVAPRYTIDTAVDRSARLTLLGRTSPALLPDLPLLLRRDGAVVGTVLPTVLDGGRSFQLEAGLEPAITLSRDATTPTATQLTVHNALARPVIVRVREPAPPTTTGMDANTRGTWTAISPRAHRLSAAAIDWLLTVPAESSLPLTYRIDPPQNR